MHARLVLTSRFESIEIGERALLDLCDQVGCCAEDRYWLVTALREALANAVRHGNREDPSRNVSLELGIEGRAMTIRVEDQGEGFDPEEIPDPTSPENLLRPSGRGIFYMRQFMNRVEFERTADGGTAVVMFRQLRPVRRSESYEE